MPLCKQLIFLIVFRDSRLGAFNSEMDIAKFTSNMAASYGQSMWAYTRRLAANITHEWMLWHKFLQLNPIPSFSGWNIPMSLCHIMITARCIRSEIVYLRWRLQLEPRVRAQVLESLRARFWMFLHCDVVRYFEINDCSTKRSMNFDPPPYIRTSGINFIYASVYVAL